jgi:hypothetical protein
VRLAENTVVLGFAACSGGTPRYWGSDGSLIPVRYARALRRLAGRVAADEPHLNVHSHIGRGSTPGLPARAAGLPAITIGCLDQGELAPRSHQQTDTAEAIAPTSIDRAIQFALLLTDRIDATVGEHPGRPSATPA